MNIFVYIASRDWLPGSIMIQVNEVNVFGIEYVRRTAQVIADRIRLHAHSQRKRISRQTLSEKMRNSGVVDFRRLNRHR